MILMAKAGLTAYEVSSMSHAEAAAWVDDVLLSMGIKPERGDVIISQRRKKQEQE